MVNHVGVDFVNCVHSYNRVLNDVFENDLGLRSTDQWDKDASMVGGVTALPMKLRLYIATTVFEDTDYFGNQFLIGLIPLIQLFQMQPQTPD